MQKEKKITPEIKTGKKNQTLLHLLQCKGTGEKGRR